MTKEEAIKMAKAQLKCMEFDTSGQDEMCNNYRCDECSLNYERGNMGEQKEWLYMAIKALEQEPCNDAISRQAVLDKIKEVCFSREQEWVDFRVSQGSNGQRDLIINFIEDLPSVQPQPKTGQWIKKEIIMKRDFSTVKTYRDVCSHCGIINISKYKNYCPNCGYSMSKPQESEE